MELPCWAMTALIQLASHALQAALVVLCLLQWSIVESVLGVRLGDRCRLLAWLLSVLQVSG